MSLFPLGVSNTQAVVFQSCEKVKMETIRVLEMENKPEFIPGKQKPASQDIRFAVFVFAFL